MNCVAVHLIALQCHVSTVRFVVCERDWPNSQVSHFKCDLAEHSAARSLHFPRRE